MNFKPLAAALLAIVLGVSAVSAQTCDVVAPPLEALASSCATMLRGELCRDGQTTTLNGMGAFSVDTYAFGHVHANYPDVDEDMYVSLAFVGAVQVQPVVIPWDDTLPPRIPVEVTLRSGKANVRPLPVRQGEPIAILDNGMELLATGVSRQGTWLRIQLPDQPETLAWINKSFMTSNYDMTLLPTVTSDQPVPTYPEFTPMQAFSFTSGSPCAGIIIQSSDNLAKMQINGVPIELHNATAFLQNYGGVFSISVLEGIVQAQAHDTTTITVEGAYVHVPMDGANQPSGAPEQPTPYDPAALMHLTGNYLQHTVAVSPPADGNTIHSALVTPLTGVWRFTFPPPYSYAAEEGPQCEPFKVNGADHLFDIYVATDGSSFSAFNKDIVIGAGVRVRPGLYELRNFSMEVLSPTEMTATYDTNPLASCTAVITITAQWLRSDV